MMKKLPVSFLLCVLASQMVTVGLALWVKLGLGINSFGYSVNYILSPGGLIFGMVGGTGAIIGCRIARMPNHGLAMGVMAMSGAAALIAYHYSLYRIFMARSGLPLELVHFSDYFSLAFGHARLSSMGHAAHDVGSWGYGFLFSHMVWVMIGACVPITSVDKLPYCSSCRGFYEKQGKRRLYFGDQMGRAEMFDAAPDAPEERAATLLRMGDEGSGRAEKGMMRYQAVISHCPSCRHHAMTESIAAHNGKYFVTVKNLFSQWRPLSKRAERVPPTAPRTGGFGRKGLT